MATTGTQIEVRVREKLDDTNPDPAKYRWTSATILQHINDVMSVYMPLHRPACMYDADCNLIPVMTITAIGDTLPVADNWVMALVHGVVAMCYEADAGDTVDTARAQFHWSKYKEAL